MFSVIVVSCLLISLTLAGVPCPPNKKVCDQNAECYFNAQIADLDCKCDQGYHGNGVVCTSISRQRVRFTLNNPPASNMDYRLCSKCYNSASPNTPLNCSSNITIVGGKIVRNETIQTSCDFRWKWSTERGQYETPGQNNERILNITKCASNTQLDLSTKWAQYVNGKADTPHCQGARVLCNNQVCDPNASCRPDPATNQNKCTCNSGYSGDGLTCQDNSTGVTPTTRQVQFTLGNPPDPSQNYRLCSKCYNSASPNAPLTCSSNMAIAAGKITQQRTIQSNCDFRWKWSTASGQYETPGQNNERILSHSKCSQNQKLIVDTKWAQYNSGQPDAASCQSPNPGLTCGSQVCDVNANCRFNPSINQAVCQCNSGFIGNGITCQASGGTICSSLVCSPNARCVLNPSTNINTCQCNSGFSGNGVSCTASGVTICSGLVCSPNARCVLNPSTNINTCQCNSGFSGNGGSCSDINECLRPNSCLGNMTCTNTQGSFSCACPTGYIRDPLNNCIDVNECRTGAANCHSSARCINTLGSYQCYCYTGYRGDGKTCTDINECAERTSLCRASTTCVNTPGSYRCDPTTNPGTGQCAGSNNCHKYADCRDTPASHTCTCRAGYIGDGFSCYDPNLVRRLNLQAKYDVASCADVNRPEVMQVVKIVANERYKQIGTITNGALKSQPNNPPTVTCAGNKMTVNWPVNKTFLPLTSTAPANSDDAFIQIAKISKKVLEQVVITESPPIIYPDIDSRGSPVTSHLTAECLNGLRFNPVTERCT